MIHITRDGLTDVTLEGHAGSGDYGKDLVCAAVSTLALTLEETVRQMHRKGWLETAAVHLEPGCAWFRCAQEAKRRAEAAAVFDGICAGFALLAGSFPGFVCYVSRPVGN